MEETFETPYYLRRSIEVKFSEMTAEWRINGKSSPSYNDVAAYVTYGTDRANAYRILEETLNLKDIRIYDTIEDADGKQKRVLNKKETTLAQQKQQAIKDAFQDWVWKDPRRRETLVTKYNELFNSTRPREYDGSHIRFGGMNPDITLREHQRNAIAHVLYGGNTVILLKEKGLGNYDDLTAHIENLSARFDALSDSIKAAEKRMVEVQALQQHIKNYRSTRQIYVEYRKSGYSKKFFEEHRQEITIHKAAKQAFDELQITKLPSMQSLYEEFHQLAVQKKQDYAEYRQIRKEKEELLIAKRTVETILNIDRQKEQEKEQEKEEKKNFR